MAEENRAGALHPFDLDLMALDALSPEEREAVEQAVADDAELRATAEAHEAACSAFHSQVFPATVELIEKRMARRRFAAFAAVPSAMLTAAAVVLLLVWSGDTRPLDEAGLAAKGDPILQVVAQRGERQFSVAPGALLMDGDALKFVVQPVNYRYVLIVAIDASGRAQTWYPFGGNESGPVRGKTELAGSVILDDAVGEETVVAVFSNSPQSASEWRQHLENRGERPDKGDIFVVSLRWSKRSAD